MTNIQTDTDTSYKTQNVRWRAVERQFDEWSLQGVRVSTDGTLTLDPRSIQASIQASKDSHALSEYGRRNITDFYMGEAISQPSTSEFAFAEAIASWNADTPDGTWVETQLRVRVDGRWTRWYSMGIWAASCSTVERRSVGEQDDADARVLTDTLVLRDGVKATAFQVKMRLFTTDLTASPQVRSARAAISTTPVIPSRLEPGDPTLWGRTLEVPQCSQMVYPDGGNVWCSAVSVAMVLAYWARDLNSPCEGRVRTTVEGVYDRLYDGHGNWPFNTAYAATHGLEAYVARFTSLAQVEPWISRGVPVIISYAWGKGDLDGAAVPSSDGHLGVLVGFDAEGDPVVNDPAARTDDAVRRTYRRSELEALWLQHAGGAVYLIAPEDVMSY